MAPGAMKWVPVNRDEPAPADEKPDKKKAEAKKEEAKGKEKAAKSKGKGKDDVESKGKKGDSKGKAKDGKADFYKGEREKERPSKSERGGGSSKADSKRADKGDGGKGAKGKSAAGKGKGRKGREDDVQSHGVKTVQEVEAEISKNQANRPVAIRRPRGGEAFAKQPIDAEGSHCEVHKHSGMGCAVVSMKDANVREALMQHLERKYGATPDQPPKVEIAGVIVQLRRHTDKTTQQQVVTDIFAAWGHKAEKESPLSVSDIADYFDSIIAAVQSAPPSGVPSMPAPAAGTLSTTPQQLMGTAPPSSVPPPPTHLPTVPMPQGSAYPGYYDYQRAMYANNPWAMHQYQQQAYYQQQQAYAYQLQQHQLQQQQWHQQVLQQQQQQQGKVPPAPTSPAAAPGDTAAATASVAPAAEATVQASGDAPVAAGGEEASATGVVAEGTLPPSTPTRPTTAGADGVSPEQGASVAAKPRIMQIVDPNSGKTIDTLGMNFEPRKPSSPLQIINPSSGEAVQLS